MTMNYDKWHVMIDQALKAGQYAVVSSIRLPFAGYPISTKAFQSRFLTTKLTLERISAKQPATTVVCETNSGGITMSLVVIPQAQGSIFAKSAESTLDTSMAVCASTPPMAEQPDSQHLETPQFPSGLFSAPSSIEESALANAELIAAEMRKRAILAIDIGNGLVSKAEQETVTVEMLPALLAGSPDPRASRATYSLGRSQPATTIQFNSTTRQVGGEKPIPAAVHSERIFSLKRCRLNTYTDARTNTKSLVLRGNPDDGEWVRLRQTFIACDSLRVDDNCPELPFIQEALARGYEIDIDVCVSETLATGKRWLIPLRVNNRSEIVDAARAHLEILINLASEDQFITDSLFPESVLA